MEKKFIHIVIAILTFVILDIGIASVLKLGVDNYFGLNQRADVLLIGHSHLMLSIDKQKMENDLKIKVSKYCREGADVEDKYFMTKQYLDSRYSDSLRVLMYGVDLFTFSPGGLSSNSYMMFYPFMDNKDINQMIRIYSNKVDYWTHKLVKTYRYNESTIKNAAIRGLMDDWSNKKYGQVDIEAYKKLINNHQERHIYMNQKCINRFIETVKMATDRGIRVILVNTPTLDILNSYEPEQFAEICQWYRDFAAKEKLVEYWDYNPEYSNRHELFYDRLHLNTKGQLIINKLITNHLCNILHEQK